ncbi:MAG: class I SAM-dependent methyltransferase [Bacteroidota bacterium]
MKLITPENWEDYELIDTGGLEKLERFGKYILTRPEPQAVWEKSMPEEEWNRLSHAVYKRTRGIDPSKAENTDKGDWKRKPAMPDQWTIHYRHDDLQLTFRLGLTSFGHIGVFPEQAVNWNYIYDFIKAAGHWPLAAGNKKSTWTENQKPEARSQKPEAQNQQPFKVLNLFAYTGGASLAAKAAGADVVHVDSVKPVINWAKEDMELSRLNDIRWVVEDAMKFVRREVKRGNKYQGIILDPPAYGRGPEGEKWVLQESINELIHLSSKLLADNNCFFILSLYSMGFSSLISESLVKTHFKDIVEKEAGELHFSDRAGRKLPLGTILRFQK